MVLVGGAAVAGVLGARPGRPGAAVGARASLAGIGALTGFAPADSLFWLYALLPLAVGFVAEQFRLAAAQTVLDARDLEDAQAVGRLTRPGSARSCSRSCGARWA